MNGYELVRLQPEQVKKAGDTMTGSLRMTNNGKFIGDLTGNADSANRLQNTRNIKVGNTTRQFNGTQDVVFDLNDIGASPSNHNHKEVIDARTDKNGTTHKDLKTRLDNVDLQLDKINLNLDISIRDYGAKCDGVTDDTNAVKQALNAAIQSGGRASVNLTYGTILISENIIVPPLVRIYGSGIYKATIKAKAGSNVTKVLDVTRDGIYCNEFSDFTIDGSNIIGITGIDFQDPTNTVQDENSKFDNILIANCEQALIIGQNNRGNRFNNINIEHCKKSILLDGTDNVLTNIIVSTIQNDGIIINGSNNHLSDVKAFYCDRNGIVVNGQINKLDVEVQENGLNGIVVNGFMNDIDILSDSNGRIVESYNIVINGYKNLVRGLCGFNATLAGNIKAHLSMGEDSVLNDVDILCHGNKLYIEEKIISASNSICINKKTYLENMATNLALEPVGGGQSTLSKDTFFDKPLIVNFNKAIHQGAYYKRTIDASNKRKFYGGFKSFVRGGACKMFIDFFNNNTKIDSVSTDELNIHHNNDSYTYRKGNIPQGTNKIDIFISVYATDNSGYSEAVINHIDFITM